MESKPTMKLETITPAKAVQYLKCNTTNRKVRKRRIDRLVKAIVEGKWELTHQGIAFNCDGTLLDGQHRLSAIIEANMAVKMWVARHIDRNAMYAVDQGLIRRPLDIIGPLGLNHADEMTNGHVATARAMAGGMYPGILGKNLGANNVSEWTNEEVLSYIERHFDAINFACSIPLGDCRNATIRATVARAWYTANRDRLAEFCEVLRTGIVASKADVSAVKVRDYFMKNGRGAGSSQVRADLYRRCEFALSQFLANNPIVRLSSSENELFPVPGDNA